MLYCVAREHTTEFLLRGNTCPLTARATVKMTTGMRYGSVLNWHSRQLSKERFPLEKCPA